MFETRSPLLIPTFDLKYYTACLDGKREACNVDDVTVVRAFLKRQAQAVALACSFIIPGSFATRFARHAQHDKVVATTTPAGVAIPYAERSWYCGTPTVLLNELAPWIEQWAGSGPKLVKVFQDLWNDMNQRLIRDKMLPNAALRVAIDHFKANNKLTAIQEIGGPSLSAQTDGASTLDTGLQRSKEVCRAFNQGKCQMQGKCPNGEKHVCLICDQGGHPAVYFPLVKEAQQAKPPPKRNFGGRRYDDRQSDRNYEDSSRDRDSDRDRRPTREYDDPRRSGRDSYQWRGRN